MVRTEDALRFDQLIFEPNSASRRSTLRPPSLAANGDRGREIAAGKSSRKKKKRKSKGSKVIFHGHYPRALYTNFPSQLTKITSETEDDLENGKAENEDVDDDEDIEEEEEMADVDNGEGDVSEDYIAAAAGGEGCDAADRRRRLGGRDQEPFLDHVSAFMQLSPSSILKRRGGGYLLCPASGKSCCRDYVVVSSLLLCPINFFLRAENFSARPRPFVYTCLSEESFF